ncbi:MAG: IclR family transcriptional regulator [Salana multivorans]|uniref:IclR family transcriptional regulator n=1 Tax=Salana multivorans TaxID=120377 RepID=UPI000959B833|nr:IclR family transcriptional regulator [Salana multivorans]MBN8881143.1 IclR family transcriptional regulator [Salana multivorans]OJX96108.1 MAG: hypothetical protein BGO96_07455 [Micrococcales bacterium 73-15]
MEKDAASPVESIDRALVVLSQLAAAGTDGLSLGQLADRLGVHKTTVHRALAALRFRDFVAQDPGSGLYRLGAAAVTLGDAYYAGDNLAASLHPALVALSREVDELVHLGTLAGAQIVYLDKVEPDRPVRVWSAVGRRMPAATTALGRAMLMDRGLSAEALAPYLAADGSGGLSGDRLADVLATARARGFASECEENEPGIACVALPLERAGAAVAAVSVTAPRERMSDERMAEVADDFRRVLPRLLPPGLVVRGGV